MNNRLNTMENETNEEMEAPKPPADHNPSLSEPSSPEPPQTNPNPIAAARTHESRFEAIHAPGRRRTSTTSSSSPSSSISSHCTSTPTPTPTHARPPTSSSQPLSRATTQRDTPNPLERSDTALSRIQTQRSQHEATVGGSHLSRRATRQSALPLPAFGGGKAYPPLLPDREEYVVEFEGEGDPRHPFNWSRKRKLRIAGTLGFATFCSSFGSSIFSAGTLVVARQFGVSGEVGILGVSLYVLGFAMGPLLWGPLSELKGRRLPMLISMFGFTIFQFAVATAKDLQTIIICRFWAGFFAAAPLALVGEWGDRSCHRSSGEGASSDSEVS